MPDGTKVLSASFTRFLINLTTSSNLLNVRWKMTINILLHLTLGTNPTAKLVSENLIPYPQDVITNAIFFTSNFPALFL
jgi:hypothetical protein